MKTLFIFATTLLVQVGCLLTENNADSYTPPIDGLPVRLPSGNRLSDTIFLVPATFAPNRPERPQPPVRPPFATSQPTAGRPRPPTGSSSNSNAESGNAPVHGNGGAQGNKPEGSAGQSTTRTETTLSRVIFGSSSTPSSNGNSNGNNGVGTGSRPRPTNNGVGTGNREQPTNNGNGNGNSNPSSTVTAPNQNSRILLDSLKSLFAKK